MVKAKVCIAVLQIMDVKIHWKLNTGVAQVSNNYRNSHKWLQNPKYSNYWPFFTTEDEWTIVSMSWKY